MVLWKKIDLRKKWGVRHMLSRPPRVVGPEFPHTQNVFVVIISCGEIINSLKVSETAY